MRSGRLKWFLLAPALIVVFLTTTYPLLSAFYFSLHRWQLSKPDQLHWGELTLDNYMRAFSDTGFHNTVIVTIEFTILSVALSVLIGLGIALILQKESRLHTIVKILLIFPFAVSPALKGYSWRFMLNPEYGIYDQLIDHLIPPLSGTIWLGEPFWAMLVLALSEVWGWAPLIALTFIGALGSISPEVIEAARMDGATSWQVFRKITLPLLKPVILVITMLKAIFSLKMFDQVVTMTRGGPGDSTQTINYYIQQTGFGRSLDIGYASAMSWILVVVLAILAVLYIRFVLRPGEA
ncbi:MAG: sugar ABC transporter permease [Burkholderiales bacterium]|nr:sugar ABC transporter permease [Anaerolineae bacterium]